MSRFAPVLISELGCRSRVKIRVPVLFPSVIVWSGKTRKPPRMSSSGRVNKLENDDPSIVEPTESSTFGA
jgi:hypothetical protein